MVNHKIKCKKVGSHTIPKWIPWVRKTKRTKRKCLPRTVTCRSCYIKMHKADSWLLGFNSQQKILKHSCNISVQSKKIKWPNPKLSLSQTSSLSSYPNVAAQKIFIMRPSWSAHTPFYGSNMLKSELTSVSTTNARKRCTSVCPARNQTQMRNKSQSISREPFRKSHIFVQKKEGQCWTGYWTQSQSTLQVLATHKEWTTLQPVFSSIQMKWSRLSWYFVH